MTTALPARGAGGRPIAPRFAQPGPHIPTDNYSAADYAHSRTPRRRRLNNRSQYRNLGRLIVATRKPRLVTNLADVPLPSGPKAAVEFNLLGRALVGGEGGSLDMALALNKALIDAGITRDGHCVRVFSHLNGVVVRESWIESREDGTARCGLGVDEATRASAHEIRVDLAEHPASDRLRQLADIVIAEVGDSYSILPENALRVSAQARSPLQGDANLVAVHQQLALALMTLATDKETASELPPATQSVIDFMERCRGLWAIDSRSAAAMILAALIPARCAVEGTTERTSVVNLTTYRRFLTIAAQQLRAGRWAMMKELVIEAARTGHLHQLDGLAEFLMTQARAFRDAAIYGPPDPLEFTNNLCMAAPFARAAWCISHWVRESDLNTTPSDRTWAARETEAEEVAVRINDGLEFNYFDCISGGLFWARRQIADAQARGDREGVRRLLQAGELAYRWPRSYRSFLRGEGPIPTARLPGSASDE